MAPKRNTIPMHRLDEMTDEGFRLKKMNAQTEEAKHAMLLGSHRDDHYLFFLQETGESRGMVDFEHFTIRENMLFIILPGQVHSYHGTDVDTSAWFMALDPGLIPDAFRAVLEDPLLPIKPVQSTAAGLAPLVKCLELVDGLHRQPGSVYSRQAILSLLVSFAAMVTELYACRRGNPVDKVSRTQTITLEFKKLLLVEYRKLKSPAEYAAALHLSVSYLNEAVKEVTGLPVSYWIQQQILLEAKRLLYYSQCSVKEIAHELGFEDHTYFSRVFKKTVGRTPLAFRGSYRQ